MTLETEVAKVGARTVAIVVLCVALAAGLAFGGWKAYRWAYDRGVAQERAAWTKAQDKANREQAARDSADKLASDSATGELATDVDTRTITSGKAAQTRSEAIQREYQNTPVKAQPCTADGRPAAIPAGVLDQLREAKRAAEAAGR